MMNDQINRAVEVLKNGGVVIFPTDTVWGMGVAADNQKAIDKFYKLKRREADKPTAILVAKPHNYPGNEEIDLPFTPRKDMVIYRQQPGIIQINSLDELPFAFEMIRRQNLTGKKEGRWAIQEKL